MARARVRAHRDLRSTPGAGWGTGVRMRTEPLADALGESTERKPEGRGGPPLPSPPLPSPPLPSPCLERGAARPNPSPRPTRSFSAFPSVCHFARLRCQQRLWKARPVIAANRMAATCAGAPPSCSTVTGATTLHVLWARPWRSAPLALVVLRIALAEAGGHRLVVDFRGGP